MKIFEITTPRKPMLSEAKARIDHPEDIMFDENGLAGAQRALSAILHSVKDVHGSTTIKWDGSPAVIFGWVDKNNFIVTDKAGIGAKKYNGRPTSAEEVTAMIFNRKPEQPGREDYAKRFGVVYDLLKRATPKTLVGQMIQGDMLWMDKSNIDVADDSVSFKANKIPYSISKDTELGKKIARSQAGIVVHGVYATADEAASAEGEPMPTTPTTLGLKDTPGIVIVGPETNIDQSAKIKLPKAEVDRVKALISSPAAQQINDMLDPFTIGNLKISNLPDIFKSFINYKAGQGQEIDDAGKIASEFIQWVKNPVSKMTASKQENVLAHIGQYKNAFNTAWEIVAGITTIKHKIKDQLDSLAGQGSEAIRTAGGHEGFVSATPHGKIKYVNRPVFMKKD
jgi:hypothetical protein